MVDLPEHEGDEAHSDHSQVQHVESAPAEAAGVEEEAIGDDFEKTLDSEDGGEEVVEVVEDLVSLWVGVERVLGGEHDTGDEDAEEDQVTKVSVVTQPVTLLTKTETKQELDISSKMMVFTEPVGVAEEK